MDLNIVVCEDGQIPNQKLIEKRLIRAYHDRFHTVALNTIIEGDQVKNVPKPLDIACKNIKILNRLTVKVSKHMQIFNLHKTENYKKYDILAIEPMNEEILNKLNSGDFQCDILTFSSPELSKVIKKSNFALSIKRNVGIEINYSGMLSSSSVRRQTIALGQLLVDKTRGKNIILSSGTRPEMSSKTPQDILALAYLFGLANNQGTKALFQMPQDVIKRSELRRNITTSIIKIEHSNDQSTDDQSNMLKRKNSDTDVIHNKKIKA